MNEGGGRPAKGILYILASSFFFALMGVFVRLAGDVPFLQKTFFRNGIAFVIAAVALLHAGRKHPDVWKLPQGGLRFLLLRSLAGTIGIFGNFYALGRINIADAATLNKLSPFFAIVFSFLLLGERILAIPLLAVFGAMGGAMLVMKPAFDSADPVPYLAGFVGGIGAGFAYTCIRRLKFLGVDGALIVTFFSAFSTFAVVPYLAFHYTPMTAAQTWILTGAGVAAAGGQFCVTAAYFAAPASRIGIFDYSQIIFSSLLGFFVFAQVPDLWSVLGYVTIVAMAVLATHAGGAPSSAAQNGDGQECGRP